MQGSKLGPVLWNYYTNDLFYKMPSDSLVNYADDNTLYGIAKNLQDLSQNLTTNLSSIMAWFKDNGLKANPDKFQSMLLGTEENCAFEFQNTNLENCNVIKLLGVNVDRNLDFSYHIDQMCIKASRQLNALKRLRKSLPIDVRLLIYKTFILCHFNFCPLAWHFCKTTSKNKLEKI